jgi:hypothetical protein
MPGLTIGGFNLCERKELQVDILVQLSTHMLERIEEMLGISAISSTQPHRGKKRACWTALVQPHFSILCSCLKAVTGRVRRG